MRKILATTALTGALLIGLPTGADATPHRPAATNPNVNCLVAFPNNVTQVTWDRLIKLGWRGDPTDGRTQLWSPGCLRDAGGKVLPVPGHVSE